MTDPAALDAALAEAYRAILAELPADFADHIKASSTKKSDGLSGMFLTSAPTRWREGRRVLLVGRETRGWGYRDFTFAGWGAYVAKGMKQQKDYLTERQTQRKGDRGVSFHNFARKLAAVAGEGNVAWANLLAFDWCGKTLIGKRSRILNKTPYDDEILRLSERLLKVVIKILKPNVVVFASGKDVHKIWCRYFPVEHGEKELFEGDDILRNELWAFRLNDESKSYYLSTHPTGSRKKSKKTAAVRQARNRLLEKLRADLGPPA